MAEQQELRIRPAGPGDSPALLALSERLAIGVAPWRDPVKVAAAVRSWVESSLAAAGRDGHAMLVAQYGDHVAGLVSLAERAHFTGQTDAYVGELVVDAGMEGRGVGQALMAAAEEWAAGRGLACITLETGTRNNRARHFYERSGYQEEDIRLTKPIAVSGG
jgi:ribosomal protein S18 acetylase RimI-like enzyme